MLQNIKLTTIFIVEYVTKGANHKARATEKWYTIKEISTHMNENAIVEITTITAKKLIFLIECKAWSKITEIGIILIRFWS